MLAIAVLPASLMITFGRVTNRPRAGWVLLMVMVALFLVGLVVCDRAEMGAPQLAGLHIIGPNMEGKEVRFGAGESVLTTIVTSNTATGSYNSMHDSFQPMGVLASLVCMLLGEVVFGGLGAGVYSIVMTALVAVFLGGLMVGRTPEYLGKKISVLGGAHSDGHCGGHEGRTRRPGNQFGTPWLHRDPVRLRFLHGQ
jgi:K+-transporting ATPase ATPase A chain